MILGDDTTSIGVSGSGCAHECGNTVNNLRFADDTDLIADSLEDLQQITDKVHRSSERLGLRIHDQKKAKDINRYISYSWRDIAVLRSKCS